MNRRKTFSQRKVLRGKPLGILNHGSTIDEIDVLLKRTAGGHR